MPNGCARARSRSLPLLPLRLFSFPPSQPPTAPPLTLSRREVILRPRNNSERKLARGNEIYSSGLRAGRTNYHLRAPSPPPSHNHSRPLGRAATIGGLFLLRGSVRKPIHSSYSPSRPPPSPVLGNFTQKLGNSAALCAPLFDLCSNYPLRINLIFYFEIERAAQARMMEDYWKALAPD